jgi:Arc/MetJ family transcription regulator
VYGGAVSRTNIDIDDELFSRARRLYDLRTKREAVNFALRQLVGDPMSLEEALGMEGVGWEGDLDAIKGGSQIEDLDDIDLDRPDRP